MVRSLALTLLHFLWQGSLVALIGAGLRSRVCRDDVHARYRISCVLLVAMGLLPLLTFATQHWNPSPAAGVAISLEPAATELELSVSAGEASGSSHLQDWFPAIVITWLVGVTLLSLRLIWNWGLLVYFKHSFTEPLSEVWQEKATRMADRLRLTAPSFLQSSRLKSPIVFGWLRPAVVLPVVALSGLHPLQVEALLAHELLHLHRRDHLVNLAQMLLETLFFYHPGTWWISNAVRADRELCCDLEASRLVGDQRSYVQALARMEEIRQMSVPALSLGARDGELLNRIRMLMNFNPSRGDRNMIRSRFHSGAVAGVGSLLVIAVMTLGSIAPAVSHSDTASQKTQQDDAGRISVSVMQDGSIGLSARTSVGSIETLTSLLKELGVQFDVEHIDLASIANPDESQMAKVMEAVRSAGLEPRPAPTTSMESLQRVPAKLSVHLPQPDSVRIVVYNVQGGEVLTLYEGQSSQGDHSFTWDGKDSAGDPVGTGMYFVRVKVGENTGARMYKVLVE